MAKTKKVEDKTLDELLDESVDLTDNQNTYINNIRFRVTNNEVVLDLYFLAPDAKNHAGLPIAYRSHRIVMPIALAKNIGELLVNGVASWEDMTGITLPISPKDLDEGITNGKSTTE